jgi:hypothetical protein
MAEAKGLKKLRSQTGKTPTHKCDNCGCMRYSPCKCQIKASTTKEPAEN